MIFSLRRDFQAESEARAREWRNLAWFDEPWTIGGLPVRVMTLGDYRTLSFVRSPVLLGHRAKLEDVAQFMWALSPYDQTDAELRDIFLLCVCECDAWDIADEIEEYLDFVFLDEPAGSSSGKRSSCTFVGAMVDIFANAYGWSDSQILATPLPRLYQLLKRIRHRNNPDAPEFTGNETAIGKFLRYVNSLPPEEQAEINARVNAGETIEIPD